MHIKAALLFLVALACDVAAADNQGFPKFYGIGDPGAAAAFAEEAKADFSILYDYDGKLSIGIGVVRDGIHRPIKFTFDELRSFWQEQRHRSFIVVTLSKANRTEADARELIARLTEYFFDCGFQRVRIHQAFGSGVGVYSDSTNPRKSSDTKPK